MSSSSFRPDDSDRTQAADTEQDRVSAMRSGSVAPPGFDLRDEIGRGGMGIVFRAFDLSLNREVAVKLLQDQFTVEGTTSARFLEEARITAQLQHPGIPAVHQVGMLSNGRPFLAMKLIKGETLEQLLKARASVAADRGKFVAIFEAMAQALAYAHSRHVIHRDLKPANVMVGAFGEVQVMDWGLAKVLGESEPAARQSDETTQIRSDRDSGSNSATKYGQFMGTPAFMPPEQALGAVDQITERSDVFGLGAVLCVILTGKPPFSGGDAETTRQLAARGKVEDAFARLDACGADPDLITLAKRCLAVEPNARPANVGDVATAIGAWRTAAEDRARKLELDRARRRVLTRAAVVLVGILAAGVGVSVWQAIRATDAEKSTAKQLELTQAAELKERAAREDAKREAQEAEAQRSRAEMQRANAEKQREAAEKQRANAEYIKSFLQGMISQVSPWDQSAKHGKANPNLTVLEALDSAVKEYLDDAEDIEPVIEAELRLTIGTAYFDMGEYKKAEDQLSQAFVLQTTLLGLEATHNLHLTLLLGDTYRKLGQHANALLYFNYALTARENQWGPKNRLTLQAVTYMAYLRADQGRYEEAEALYRRAAVGLEAIDGFESYRTLEAYSSLADTLRMQMKLADAKAVIERTIRGLEKLAGPTSPTTLFAINELAMIHESESAYDLAEPLYERSVRGLEAALGVNHHETLIAKQNQGSFYRNIGNYTKALQILEQIHQARLARYGLENPNTLYVKNHLAMTYQAKGDNARAELLYREAIRGLSKVIGPTHLETLACMTNLADMYRQWDRLADAEPLNVAVLKAKEAWFGPDHVETLYAVNNLALLRDRQGKFDEAEKLYLRAVKGLRERFSDMHREPLQAMSNLADLYRGRRMWTQAESLYETVIAARMKMHGDAHDATQTAKCLLGTIRESQGRYAEAEVLFRGCIAWFEKAYGPENLDTLTNYYNLGYVFMSQNRPADAEPWLRKAADGRLKVLGIDKSWTRETLYLLTQALEEQGKLAEMEPYLRVWLVYRQMKEPDTWTLANTRSRLGAALAAKKQFAEAEPLLLEGFEELKRREQDIPPFYRGLRIREAAERVVRYYEQTVMPTEAAKWREIAANYRELAPSPRIVPE